jgi:hypothetical protein
MLSIASNGSPQAGCFFYLLAAHPNTKNRAANTKKQSRHIPAPLLEVTMLCKPAEF